VSRELKVIAYDHEGGVRFSSVHESEVSMAIEIEACRLHPDVGRVVHSGVGVAVAELNRSAREAARRG
jgi:hypothetical protein